MPGTTERTPIGRAFPPCSAPGAWEARSRWQLKAAFGVATALVLAHGLGFPRPMWMGIAAMSVLLPSRQAIPGRVKGRIWGNLAGARAFACCTACCRAVCCPIWGFSAALAWAFRPPMAGRRCLTPWAPCPSWWEP
ncbi:MAG: FUSC family protein [Evtepia gabavorous]